MAHQRIEYSGWGFVTHWIAPAGAWLRSRRSRQIARRLRGSHLPRAAVRAEDTGLRVFMQISDLKIVVRQWVP